MAVVLSLTLYVATKQSDGPLAVKTTTPRNEEKSAPTDNGITITFNKPLDMNSPYTSYNVRPQTEGRVEYANNELRFIPTGQLLANTTYTITLKGAKSGKTMLADYILTFTTGDQKLSAFEQSLPIFASSYTIERLRDNTILVTITAPPTEDNTSEAIKLLTDNGIDISRIVVVRSQSSSE